MQNSELHIYCAFRAQLCARPLRIINDERTAMRLMGYDPNFIAKRVGDA